MTMPGLILPIAHPCQPWQCGGQAEEAGRTVSEKRGPGGNQESVTVVMAGLGGDGVRGVFVPLSKVLSSGMG